MWPGMMPILHWPGVMTPGQLGPIRRDGRPSMKRRTDHVEHGDALGDADDELDARVDGLQDRVGRERRGHEDHDALAPVFFTAPPTVSKMGT
jgi:hypothetical protein